MIIRDDGRRSLISRRTVLRAGAAGIALPFLEAMLPRRAHADAVIPRRYLIVAGGHSTGCEPPGANIRDLQAMPSTLGEVLSPQSGANYAMPYGWTPITPMRESVAVVSGLTMDTGVPLEHGIPFPAMVTGLPIDSFPRLGVPPAPSTDQLMLGPLGAGGLAFPSLQLYSDDPRVRYTKTLSVAARNGGYMALDPITNPHQLFQTLFGNFAPGATPAEKARRELLQRRHGSVLDLVQRQSFALRAQLGAADQRRLDGHLDSIRDLERRLQLSPPPLTTNCKLPADPGMPMNVDWDQQGYLFADLLFQAVACDLTRVATWILTDVVGADGHGVTIPLGSGARADAHAVAHGTQGPSPSYMNDTARAMRWHLDRWAYLVDRLRGTPEGNGTMLDHTLVVYLPEMGFGREMTGGTSWSSHGVDGRQVIYATGLAALNVGMHVTAQGRTPSEVLLTLMRALGYVGDLGTTRSELVELRR